MVLPSSKPYFFMWDIMTGGNLYPLSVYSGGPIHPRETTPQCYEMWDRFELHHIIPFSFFWKQIYRDKKQHLK